MAMQVRSELPRIKGQLEGKEVAGAVQQLTEATETRGIAQATADAKEVSVMQDVAMEMLEKRITADRT